MRRVIILGNAGSGKSTLARALGGKLDLRVHHLDMYFWKAGWIKEERLIFEWNALELPKAEAWIIEGTYARTLPARLERADTLIFLDFSRFFCLKSAFLRSRHYRGRSRPDIPEGCLERFNYKFIEYIWTHHVVLRNHFIRIQLEYPHLEVIVLRSRGEIGKFLERLPKK